MYLLGVQILFASSGLGGLGAMFPFAIYLFLGLINVGLVINYFSETFSKKLDLDLVIIALAFVNIVFIICHNTITSFATT